MNVTLAVLADFASITADQKLNILGIFQEINPTQFPFTLPFMVVVTQFDVPIDELDREVQVRITLVDSADAEVFIVEGPARTPARRSGRSNERGVLNQVVGLAALTFHRSGLHTFGIDVDSRRLKDVTVFVNEPPAESAHAG